VSERKKKSENEIERMRTDVRERQRARAEETSVGKEAYAIRGLDNEVYGVIRR